MTQTPKIIRHLRLVSSFALLILLVGAALPAFAADGSVLHEGRWTKKGFDIEGSWSIVEEGGQRFVVLSDDFRTKSAPDLKLFLSPRAGSDVSSTNATRDAARIGPIESHRGGQRIAIPAEVDLTGYETLVLHCEQYSKLWGVADLD